VMILEKGRAAITGVEVELDAERAAEDPKVFTAVKLIYTFTGKDLKRAVVERAVALSAEKYCSASKMFELSAELTHEIIIQEA